MAHKSLFMILLAGFVFAVTSGCVHSHYYQRGGYRYCDIHHGYFLENHWTVVVHVPIDHDHHDHDYGSVERHPHDEHIDGRRSQPPYGKAYGHHKQQPPYGKAVGQNKTPPYGHAYGQQQQAPQGKAYGQQKEAANDQGHHAAKQSHRGQAAGNGYNSGPSPSPQQAHGPSHRPVKASGQPKFSGKNPLVSSNMPYVPSLGPPVKNHH